MMIKNSFITFMQNSNTNKGILRKSYQFTINSPCAIKGDKIIEANTDDTSSNDITVYSK